MSVVLNEPALRLLLESPTGPVGNEVITRAERIREIARINASGGWLNIDTGDLVGSLRLMREGVDTKGFFVVVGADAQHRGFRYPGFWDENGRPWLSEAVADVFPQMAGVGPQDLHDLAQEFLDACVDALDTIPTFVPGSVGSPARTFVSPGKPAYDCCLDGQLTVHVQSIQERFGAQKDVRINDVTMIATALRCIPMPDQDPPDPALMEASAEQINMDRWALWNHVYNMIKECDLFDKCCGVRWLGLQSIDSQGMCGGSTLTIAVCLDGYEEVCST